MARIIHTRLSENETKTIDQLVKAGVVNSRSMFIRNATKMLLSQYTGEPDINAIEKRLRDLENKISEYIGRLERLEGKIAGL